MRQFVAEKNLDSKGCLTVEGKKYHYLSSVLRVCSGDMIYVRLTDGSLQQMTVSLIDSAKKKIVLQCAGDIVQKESIKASPIKNKSSLELWLFMFIAKPPKMDLIIRQAVECGVSYIVPVEGEFSQKGSVESARKKCDQSDDRWKRIITEAMEQSGSPVETKILPCVTVSKACELWKENTLQNADECAAVVLYEQTSGTMELHCALSKSESIKKAALAVGCEGGISPEEIQIMQTNGFIPVHFATNILRCETAAIYGMAALQNAIVEKDKWQFRG